MLYNLKRALGISLVLYIATFIVGIVCGAFLGHDMSSTVFPESFWYIGMVAAVILTALFTLWYFKNKNIIPSAKSGLLFGLTAIILSSILDYVLFAFGNSQGAAVDLGMYYGDYRFWIILVLVVATAKVVGYVKRTKNPAPESQPPVAPTQ